MKKYASFLKRKIHRLHEQMRSYFRHSQTATISQANESGRSMVEILAVLAIMGVLAVVGIVVYKYAMDKHRANTILQDAHLGFASIRGTRAEQFDWTPVNFEPKSGKPVDVLRDSDRDDYVRVQEIELSVCKQILLMAVPGKLMFYDEQGEDMLSCPDETNTIIFAFEGTRAPGVNCETGTDCEGEGEGAYCNTDKGVCRTCPVEEGFVVSPNGEACWPVCDEDTETTCMTDTEHWCCDNETEICGDKAGVCQPSNGQCEYRVKDQTTTRYADCSYSFAGDQTITRYADCSYSFAGDQTTTRYADCSYIATSSGNTFTLTAQKSCPNGQYCYINYKDENCENTLSNESVGVMYGTCMAKTLSKLACRIKEISGGKLSPIKSCPSGQYCYINYKDENCENTLSNESVGVMYGTCMAKTLSKLACRIKEISGGKLSPIKSCPSGQYCYINYKDENCENTLSNESVGVMYGTCMAKTLSKLACRIKETSSDMLSAVQKCPSSQYCYLNYASPDCKDPVSPEGADPIYGICLPKDSNKLICPIQSNLTE